ncbi:MAG: bifunctional 4-hydroxy-2-oxoglutarate aldolase/2-dehydro-3-deoxy-phosphogluconate aldolase [Acidobacteriota bacterium]
MDERAFVERVGRVRAIAIIRASSKRRARIAMEAAVDGGFQIVEFTLNTPGAIELVRLFSRRRGLTVGAGTVLHARDAAAAVDAGASFLVSPVLDEAVLRRAGRLGVPLIPGTHTPTEMWRAHDAGCPIVKLFPSPGPAYLRYCLGPMPFLRIVPTSGVDPRNARAHLDAGAFAVGLGGALFAERDVAAEDAGAIRRRARSILRAIAR